MKKLLSVILTVAIVLGCLPVAFAEKHIFYKKINVSRETAVCDSPAVFHVKHSDWFVYSYNIFYVFVCIVSCGFSINSAFAHSADSIV